MFVSRLLPVLLLLLPASPAGGHPSTDEQLAALDQRSLTANCPAADEVRRGRLLRDRGSSQEATQAFERALRCDPESIAARLGLAELRLESGRATEAFRLAHEAVQRQAAPATLRMRGACHFALGDFAAAADDYDAAIRDSRPPLPEQYLERLHAQRAARRFDLADEGLRDGLNRLGPVPSLLRALVEVRLSANDYEGALRALALADALPGQEVWLLERARLLEMAGRPWQARDAYERTLQALERRAPVRRATRGARALEAEARAALARLETGITTGDRYGIRP